MPVPPDDVAAILQRLVGAAEDGLLDVTGHGAGVLRQMQGAIAALEAITKSSAPTVEQQDV